MSDVVGRAGFHAIHTKSLDERGAILHEMMRELHDESIAYWAARNPNIVVADEALNEAYVNDGNGDYRRCRSRQEVIDYGDKRVAKVKRKIRPDTLNAKTGRTQGGTVTTTMIVAHLPKSMCVEIPDFYPVLDRNSGKPVVRSDGSPLMRSRWVARDRVEARRYFVDVLEILETTVIPGGRAGVLGVDIQHSESTPHIQILADTFAEDPEDAGALRAEASRTWFSHREVLDENGKQKSGKAKLRGYHAHLKAQLIARGYDISPDFDDERHMTGYTKDDYTRVQDQERSNADAKSALDVAQRNLRTDQIEVEADKRRLSTRLALISEERDRAVEEGRADGRAELADQLSATERAQRAAELTMEAARAHEVRLRSLYASIERDLLETGPAPQPPTFEELREAFLSSQPDVAMRFMRTIKFRDGTTAFDRFEPYARAEFEKQHPLARAAGASYEAWLNRTVAMQRKIDRALLRQDTDPVIDGREAQL